jgi:hypothetical protein
VRFLAYVLWKTLEQWQSRPGPWQSLYQRWIESPQFQGGHFWLFECLNRTRQSTLASTAPGAAYPLPRWTRMAGFSDGSE